MVKGSSHFNRPSLLGIAELAYKLTAQDWSELNCGECAFDENRCTGGKSSQIDFFTENILALLLVRIIAILHKRSYTPKLPHFRDLSTTTICRTIMANEAGRKADRSSSREMYKLDWPEVLTGEVIYQLKSYITKVLSMYRAVFYHNCEHAHHVFLNANKLLDSMLCEYCWASLKDKNDETVEPGKNTTVGRDMKNNNTRNAIKILKPSPKKKKITYGLKSDPDIHFAFLFSALVHDIDHKGVTNKQLITESDELAIVYNDQSVAEQRSLAIAFTLLMKHDFQTLRSLIFVERQQFHRFRSNVIDLVLCTDISSPERVQILKSKWSEAFGSKDKEVIGSSIEDVVRESVRGAFELDTKKDFLDTPMCIFLASHKPNAVIDVEDVEAGFVEGSVLESKRKNGELEEDIDHIVKTIMRKLNKKQVRRNSLVSDSVATNLGIRKALDRTGDFIEAYEDSSNSNSSDPDLSNSLKAIVILELMLNTADIGANMQKWDIMLKWSRNLFDELKTSFVLGRGFDPGNGWHGHQIAFFDSYVLPLASSLNQIDIIEQDLISQLRFHVLENHIEWKNSGTKCVDEMVHPWNKLPDGFVIDRQPIMSDVTMNASSIMNVIIDLRSAKENTKDDFLENVMIPYDTESITESEKYNNVMISSRLDEVEYDDTFQIDRHTIGGLQYVVVCYLMFMHIGPAEGSLANLRKMPMHEHLFFLICGYSLAIPMKPIIVTKTEYVRDHFKELYPIYFVAVILGLSNLLLVCRPSTFNEKFHWGAQPEDTNPDGDGSHLFCEGTPAIPGSYWGNLLTTIVISLLGLAVTPLWPVAWFLGYSFWFNNLFWQCLVIFPTTYNTLFSARNKSYHHAKIIAGMFFLSYLIVFAYYWFMIVHIQGEDRNDLSNEKNDQDFVHNDPLINACILHFFLFGPLWMLYFVMGICLAFIYDTLRPADSCNRKRWGWVADMCTLIMIGINVVTITQESGNLNKEVIFRLWYSLRACIACPLTTLWVFALSTGEGLTAMALRGKFFMEYLSPNAYSSILYHQIVSEYYFLATRGEYWSYWSYRESFYWFSPKPCPIEWYEFPLVIGLTTSFSLFVKSFILATLIKLKKVCFIKRKRDEEI